MPIDEQFACAKSKPIIAISAPVTVEAGAKDDSGKTLPPKFVATFYTGVAMNINGWDLPVVVDLAGLEEGKSLVANLDHDATKRVGNFALANDGKSLVANGTASARTPARDEVIGSAEDGFSWQASLEVNPIEVEAIKKGQQAEANGRTFEGPLYITRKGMLKGFAFVSHGADDNTSANIAASAASNKEQKMKPEVKAWLESLGLNADIFTPEQVANLEADYSGRQGVRTTPQTVKGADPFGDRKKEVQRREEMRAIADKLIERRGLSITSEEITAIEKMYDHAVEAGMTPQEFRIELYEATVPMGHTVRPTRDLGNKLTNRVLEAAICQAGNLKGIDKHFSDQELQTARDKFRDGISLNQFLILAAEANGFHGSTGGRVNAEVQNAAFGMFNGPHGRIHAAGGFSTIDVANIVAATANKFLHEGWMAVDQTPLRIAAIRPVRNFQQITTVSLTGHLQYNKIGPDGEIKHGQLDDLTYTNQVDTYATMLAITRKDIINDDLGALTAVPRRLGRGGALKLNDIFWTEFLSLVSTSFFAAGNSNINTGVADMTLGGLTATETIFMNQTDPDGKPLGIMPKIILVPTALKAAAIALMDPQSLIITGSDTKIPNTNVFKGRFAVESSPYISNSSYTGNTAVGWWMLADPSEAPVIEIAALNGRVEPVVETADADFNVLGIQMRGYSDIGVNDQEYRGGVYADGGAS